MDNWLAEKMTRESLLDIFCQGSNALFDAMEKSGIGMTNQNAYDLVKGLLSVTLEVSKMFKEKGIPLE